MAVQLSGYGARRRRVTALCETGEDVLGAVVLIAMVWFAAQAFAGDFRAERQGYILTARFDRVDGLREAADVRVAGIKKGQVQNIILGADNYPVVSIIIDNDVTLPLDATASIQTDGMFGGKYIELTPGAEDAPLRPGGEIRNVRNSVVLVELLELIVADGKRTRKAQKKP